MSFWNLSDGETVDNTTTEYEAPGGSFELFPNNTDVMAIIDEIKWVDNKEEYGGGRYINYRIQVVKPEAYKNRKSYFKLWVNGDNPNKKDADAKKKQGDKDKRLLGAMAVNAGGGLMNVSGTPTDEDLTRELTQKMMVFKLGAYEMTGDDGQPRSGNYVMAVSPKTKGVDEAVKPQVSKPSTGGSSRDLDDDIPF
jgi:hypothetical protein